MVYAAPPLRAFPPRVADACLAARGGLEGGDGIPELTSGTPPGPGRRGSGVMEAVKAGSSGVYGVAASADIARGRVRMNATITTHTTTASFRHRHCYSIATVGSVLV